MKTNKFFAVALAALTVFGLVSCNGNENKPDEPFALTENSITLKVGDTHQLTANATVDTWTTNNADVATVDDKGLVLALKEGNAIISATAKGVTKTCVVSVKSTGDDDNTPKEVKGSQIWTVVLDEPTATKNASKIVASFAPDEQNKFLYVWESTYLANDNPTGRGFYGSDGYLAMTVGGSGWSGCGFCLTETGTDWQEAEKLRAAIVANPDDYYLHLAIKSTDTRSHCFYMFGAESTKFVLGNSPVYDGPIYKDFTRDGEWKEFDIPMSSYATALATTTCVAGVNVFVILSEGVLGTQLNLDAVYFYKK